MSSDDITNKWLFVAYSAKKDGTEDRKGTITHYAGNKGVGRFSCDRLGRYLHMEAKTQNETDVNILELDWGKFEVNSQDEFQSISVLRDKITAFTYPSCLKNINLTHGVILKISGLRDSAHWNKKTILDLKRALGKLIDPFNGKISNRKIEIISPRDIEDDKEIEDEEPANVINGDVENHLFELLENKTTSLKAQICRNLLMVQLIDRGLLIYKTEEDIADDYPDLLNVEFNAVISFLNRTAKAAFRKQMGLPSVQYGSLFLIRNEFRVFPIGEELDDFWGIDRRKQQGYNRYIGTRDLLGCISIQGSDESFNDKFKEASSRNQGLIKTKAVGSLQECVLRCIRKLEAYLTTVTWLDDQDKDESTPARLSLETNRNRVINLVKKLSLTPKIRITYYNRDLISILNEKSNNYQESLSSLKLIAEKNQDKELESEIAKAEKRLIQQQRALDEAKKIAQAEIDARQKAETVAELAAHNERLANEQRLSAEQNLKEEQKRNLFLVASTSKGKEFLECFIHQINMSAANAKQLMQEYLILAKSNSLTNEEIVAAFSEQIESLENIFTLSKFAIFGNFRLDSETINDDLCMFIEQYITKLAPTYESRIKLSCNHLSSTFLLKFNPIEIVVIIDNLISNAKKAGARNIRFDMETDKNILLLKIIDDGNGIKGDTSRIFEKGYTRTNGSGLGLFFCKKLLKKLNADIFLSSFQPKPGTSFTIRIPRR